MCLIYFLYSRGFRHPKGPAELSMVYHKLWVEDSKIRNSFHLTKKRNTEDILYRGKAQILAKESSCWAGPQHMRWQQIEPEGSKVAGASKATQKCSEEKYNTCICTVFSPPLPALLQGAAWADGMVVGMAEELGTTLCCTCGRTDATSSSGCLLTAWQWGPLTPPRLPGCRSFPGQHKVCPGELTSCLAKG